ncbi:endoplasmic reticulum resident protein 27 isoform X1 [Brachyhypopomus gauderio]|uniref:endoplasmic reticulum resident protein 27 isoform X1 n=1 Tax=Brachyhypopomus gauderio TaxID=698409 RepID=UPI00404144C6
MLFVFLFLLMLAFCTAADKENALPRLTDISAAASFIGSAEVVVVGFFETDGGHGYKEFLAAAEEVRNLPAALCSVKEVWANYSVSSDAIVIFRKVDLHQEHLQLSKIPNLDTDGVVRFFTINNIRFITEYNPVSAVGLFQSKVKVHLVLMAHRGSSNYKELKGRLEVLAPQYAGKLLFVLVNGKDKANARVLDYFRLKSRELPRVGLYDGSSDQSWLMAPGEISADRVRNFCDSFLSGELQKEKVSGEQETRTEL